jgi:uncharacterized circularly permuted ATP-grasp superfamily protein/uncharacterized alpha-E superfamily protein
MTVEATALPTPDPWLLDGYHPLSGVYDELMEPTGKIRPHWHGFIDALSALPPAERLARAEQINRRVRDVGIAHDIFADPDSAVQRWRVNLVPLIFAEAEWAALERALIQRVRLFNAILSDLYGAQELLRSRAIPPQLIFSDPSFLHPLVGVAPVGGQLQFYAADLARGPDGQWRIIDNHTETPAGSGYAVANRIVHTQVAGDLFTACKATRIAAFFKGFQAKLAERAGRGAPRLALLTPGPHHEDFFSHTYLARYLGFLLVEGNDLRVDNDRVFVKTLEGPKPIDLIIRCIDGRICDPLELDPSGLDGTVGLVQAARRAPEIVVNAIGSAIVQNRGLGNYLPALSQRLLGEPLMLRDAPRLWLGDAAARAEIHNKPDRVVIRQAQEGTGRPGRAERGKVPATLSPDERELLWREIELNGAGLVAEENVGFGTLPTLTPAGLVPQSFAVRLFVASTSAGYEVMPGGLAMTVDPSLAVALSAPEGDTRDVWVVSDAKAEPHVSLWRPVVETARTARSQRLLQSRVADNLFWLGRYAERADWTMRVLRGAQMRVQEDRGPPDAQLAAHKALEALLAVDAELPLPPIDKPGPAAVAQLSRLVISAKVGTRTLERSLDNLHRLASLTRDGLSLEAWRTLNAFRGDETWRKSLSAATGGSLLDRLEDGLAMIATFNGLTHENMTRNYGWSFMDMGRRLERAYNLSEMIDWLFAKPTPIEEESNDLLLLLELADSFITYRSRYRLDPMLSLVLDLLLLDESNPRSLAFQLAAIDRHLESLPQSKQGANLSEERRLILALLTAVRLMDVAALSDNAARPRLEQFLRTQMTALPELSDDIARHYFSLTEDQPHRVHTHFEPRS